MTESRAAQGLDINLTIIYGRNNRIYNYNALRDLVNQKNKPDYVIFSPFDGTAERSFNLLNKTKVSYITLERTLHAEQQGNIEVLQIVSAGWSREKTRSIFSV